MLYKTVAHYTRKKFIRQINHGSLYFEVTLPTRKSVLGNVYPSVQIRESLVDAFVIGPSIKDYLMRKIDGRVYINPYTKQIYTLTENDLYAFEKAVDALWNDCITAYPKFMEGYFVRTCMVVMGCVASVIVTAIYLIAMFWIFKLFSAKIDRICFSSIATLILYAVLYLIINRSSKDIKNAVKANILEAQKLWEKSDI